MRWDNFFQDLEDQLSAEWEAERAALDSETERLRIARLGLRDRIAALAADGASVRLELSDGTVHETRLDAVGADWAAARRGDGSILLAPLAAIVSVSLSGVSVVASAREGTAQPDRLAERVTFGFALRDLARRRVAVTMGTTHGRNLSGTFDRVAADHADVALHDHGAPRREAAVRGYRIIPLDAVAWVRVDVGEGTALAGRA